ncbi:hypothetical protein WME94_06945 [Sorangium sp. So ce429]
MASVKTYKKWHVPLGWWISLSHNEACMLTSESADTVRNFLISLIPGPWTPVVAAAISIQSRFIRAKNEDSGGQGVKLLFLWATGVIISVERLGRGRSPC